MNIVVDYKLDDSGSAISNETSSREHKKKLNVGQTIIYHYFGKLYDIFVGHKLKFKS